MSGCRLKSTRAGFYGKTSRMFPYTVFTWFDSGCMLASGTDVFWIMQRQVPAFLRSVGAQTMQKTIEFSQIHGCGRQCAHAATSGRSSDEIIDKLTSILRWDFRRIFTAFSASVHPDVEGQMAGTPGV